MDQSPELIPAALYARVSSDRQDVDLSVAAQLRALRDFAERNGYVVVREYVDEAESGRVANRPKFRQMLDEAAQTDAPFQEILVWKFSRFTRKREHAVAFKSMLRRRGIRVTSITEHADDTPTGKLMEAIIESVDEFYSENLAQEVTRGMREAASRGFFLASKAPYGYERVKVQDGPKERPTLILDPQTAPIVKQIFEMSQRGLGLKEIARDLNERGITIQGRRWYKRRLHYLLTNEAYTGTSVWGRTAKDGQAPDPVRVENAWPAIVSREQFEAVGRGLKARSPKARAPRGVGSKFLLSGLLRCGRCGKSFVGHGAKGGKFSYYVCNTLHREGAGACQAPYLSAPKLEELVTHKVLTRILNEQTIIELVQMVAEEIDAMAAELNTQRQAVETELADVRRRLAKLYDALENSDLTYQDLSPRIHSLRGQEDQLAAAHENATLQLEQRRAELPSSREIKRYVADFREFLQAGSIPERKSLIRNFVKRIKIAPKQVTLTYTIPMPTDGAMIESESVLGIVQSSPPTLFFTSHRSYLPVTVIAALRRGNLAALSTQVFA
ncbi:MAG: recombinase family protein [Chloroflexi bacterium]|nr:recombinase family protein [Chloroflexota bacterium]